MQFQLDGRAIDAPIATNGDIGTPNAADDAMSKLMTTTIRKLHEEMRAATPEERQLVLKAYDSAQCGASDDPRLR